MYSLKLRDLKVKGKYFLLCLVDLSTCPRTYYDVPEYFVNGVSVA